MKRYGDSFDFRDSKKYKVKEWRREHDAGGFRCAHCRQYVVINEVMGTQNRNHCNWCLWSKHVDEAKGDRRAECQGGMGPIGLTLKHEGYGRMGEIMLIHLCSSCPKISINRIARDDPEHRIQEVFIASLGLKDMFKNKLDDENIYLLTEVDDEMLRSQLFGVAM